MAQASTIIQIDRHPLASGAYRYRVAFADSTCTERQLWCGGDHVGSLRKFTSLVELQGFAFEFAGGQPEWELHTLGAQRRGRAIAGRTRHFHSTTRAQAMGVPHNRPAQG